MSRMRAVAVTLFFAVVGVDAGSARATVVVPVTHADMARACAAAVRGTVVGRRSAWDAQRRRIYSYTEIEVQETFAGTARKGSRVTVRSLGGVVGDIGMNVSGTARFREGEEVVVFLEPDRLAKGLAKGRFVIFGMSQGKFRVDRKGAVPMALRDTAGLSFATPRQDGPMRLEDGGTENRLALDLLRDRIRAARRPATPLPSAPSDPALPAPQTPAVPGTPPVPDAP